MTWKGDLRREGGQGGEDTRETKAMARPASYPGIIPGSFLFTEMTHMGSREQAGMIPPFSWDNP